jgi:hydroxymethylpyrimidine pyrophosphatase-like HAD family hydrolase
MKLSSYPLPLDSLLKKTNPNLNTIDDKYYTLVQKFIDLQEQTKKGQLANKESERTIISLTKQRDSALSDYSKMLLGKDKLESLCRELQKHNKLIKDENLLRIKEEEEKRKEISAKFQIAIDDINKQVSSNADKNNSIMQENANLTNKMKTLLEQYEIREQVCTRQPVFLI